MKILIATGIYPPEIGGPAQYAKNLKEVWRQEGHKVSVRVFTRWNHLPSGIRHIAYFFSLFPNILRVDFVLALDTYSCALPAVVASRMFGKKIILRTGGDFLWESYVERTGDLVLLRDFYKTRLSKLSLKERVVFKLTGLILRNLNAIIWSTEWQRDIFMEPYGLQKQRHFIVENYYGPRLPSYEPKQKNFIAFTRKLKWKRIELLKKVFNKKEVINSGAILDNNSVEHSNFLEIMRYSYAVIIASLGDISPNTILDAIRCQKPFILTQETGLYKKLKDVAVFVDPQNEKDVAEKVLWLSDPVNYNIQKEKVEAFTFVHTWEEIADEYINIYEKIK